VGRNRIAHHRRNRSDGMDQIADTQHFDRLDNGLHALEQRADGVLP
tara:strand:+ start:576 stop:713 length:138 start_codon:yes stop_codon:yes gene_type:complete